MEAKPFVRHFRDEDFYDLVAMFDETWGWELKGTDEDKLALATLYIACAVAGSDRVFVAEANGKAVATACLQSVEDRAAFAADTGCDKARYLTLIDQSRKKLAKTEAGRFALDFYKDLDAVNERLIQSLAKDGKPWDAELKLLLTSPNCRGMGLGKMLLQAVFDDLKKFDKRMCMLRTDTHCAWQYYEKTGWSCDAKIDWEDDSDITAFAFRKAVV